MTTTRMTEKVFIQTANINEIYSHIQQNVRLVKGTDQYGRWVEVPQPLDFKVYIFNVTNVDEIQRGLQPKVEEIGPYVYT